MAASGHSRPRERILHAIGCPLRPESDQARAAAQYVAKGHQLTFEMKEGGQLKRALLTAYLLFNVVIHSVSEAPLDPQYRVALS